MTPVKPTSLLGLHAGDDAVIETVSGGDELRGRLSAMGLHEGRRIRRLADSGRSGPMVVDVMGSTVALGRRMAGHILVQAQEHRLLLTGNPNVGKSVVFSRLTGLDAMSSNYPGTTVEFLSGTARFQGERFQVIDVPGTYSLSAASPAESVACRIIEEAPQAVVVHVIDATNLERNLLFALQMLERGRRFTFPVRRCRVSLGISGSPAIATRCFAACAISRRTTRSSSGQTPTGSYNYKVESTRIVEAGRCRAVLDASEHPRDDPRNLLSILLRGFGSRSAS